MIDGLPPEVSLSQIGEEVPSGMAEQRIESVETRFGHPLPKDYRAFLSQAGPALFVESGGAFEGMTPSDRASDGKDEVEMFFGLADDENGIASRAAMLRDQLPDDLLPIADAPGGDVIALHPTKGVFYWNHETGQTFPSAPDFELFLSLLGATEANSPASDGIISGESSLDF